MSGPSWAPWRTVARCLEGAPLAASEMPLFERCTGRAMPPTAPPSEAWVIAGRRSGKTRFAGAVAVRAAGFTSYPTLAPGEQAVVALAAADRDQARILLSYAVDPFTETEALRPVVKARSLLASLRDLVTRSHRWGLDLANRVSIEVRTSHYGRVRGRTFALVVADEVSFWQDETGSNPASAVLTAIRPGLATLGGQLLVITTPYAKHGPTWDTYQRFWGQDGAGVLVWRADSMTMNPTLPRSVIEAALARDEAAARSEWGGAFRDDAAALVAPESLQRVTVPGRGPLPPERGVDYLAFCDVSTGSGADSMCLAIVHGELVDDEGGQERGVIIVDGVWEAVPAFDPLEIARTFASTLKGFGCWSVIGDRFAAGWTTATFGRLEIHYVPSELSRSECYVEFLALVNARGVELPDAPKLLDQLARLQRKPGASGREVVDHPVGGHDDLSNTVAGACALAHRRLRRAQALVW